MTRGPHRIGEVLGRFRRTYQRCVSCRGGQNRTDHRAIVDARHAGDVSPLLRYRWADETDLLVWAPGAIAGITLATRRSNASWLELFAEAGGDLRVVDINPQHA